jgi:hypothetical protein
MLNYIYNYKIEGEGNSHYLDFSFDRQITKNRYYLNTTLDSVGPKKERSLAKNILERISHIKGVIIPGETNCPSGLIRLDGNELLVQICEIQPQKIQKLSQTIVKKMQRIIAPNESRKRIGMKTLKDFSKKTFGKT